MITKLEVSNFRNIKYSALNFETECAILMGANGIGKSNSLNALNWLVTNTLLTDKWGSGENDLNSVFAKDYVAGQNPSVTITLDTGTTFTKKFVKGKSGNNAEYYVNGVKKTKTEFEADLFLDLHFVKKLRCEKEVNELRLFTDPLYALQKLDAKALRLLLVELGCSVSNEEVYESNSKFEELKQYEAKYRSDFTVMRTSLKTDRQDLNKQVEATDMLIDSIKVGEYEPSIKAEREETKNKLMLQLNDLKSGARNVTDDLENKLKDIKHQKELFVKEQETNINSKISILKEKKENALNYAREKQNERLQAINSQIQVKSEELNTLEASKEAYQQTLDQKRNEAANYKAKTDKLMEYKKAHEEMLERISKSEFKGYVTCPDCGKIFATDPSAELLFNKQKQDDIANHNTNLAQIEIDLKQIEKDFFNCIQLGKKAKAQLEEVETKLTKVNREISELNDSKRNAESETTLADTDRLEQIELEIVALESQDIDTTKYDVEINNLNSKIQQAILEAESTNKQVIEELQEKINYVDEQIRECYRAESLINSKNEAQNKRSKLVSELNNIDYLIELVNSFIQTKIKMINHKAKDITGIDFVMLEENLTNDGVKEVCYATVDGVEFANVNTSQKVVAGIQFIEKIKEILGANNLPILADRLEGFDDLEKIKGLTTEQMICTVVGNKNQKEIIVM